jgi:hypothetical protein
VWLVDGAATTKQVAVVINRSDPSAPISSIFAISDEGVDRWSPVSELSFFVAAGAVIEFMLLGYNEANSPSDSFTAPYLTTDVGTTPAAGEITVDPSDSFLWVHRLDRNAADRDTDLDNIFPGSTVVLVDDADSNTTRTYLVTGPWTSDGTIYKIPVAFFAKSGDTLAPGTAVTASFNIPSAKTYDYARKDNYWPTATPGFASSIIGQLVVGNALQGGESNTAFGFDIQFQQLIPSPDWLLISYPVAGGSGLAPGAPIEVVDNLDSFSSTNALSANQGRTLGEKDTSLQQQIDALAASIGGPNNPDPDAAAIGALSFNWPGALDLLGWREADGLDLGRSIYAQLNNYYAALDPAYPYGTGDGLTTFGSPSQADLPTQQEGLVASVKYGSRTGFLDRFFYSNSAASGHTLNGTTWSPLTLQAPNGTKQRTTFSHDGRYMAAAVSRAGNIIPVAWTLENEQWVEIAVQDQAATVGTTDVFVSRTGRWLLAICGLGTPWTAWELVDGSYVKRQEDWGSTGELPNVSLYPPLAAFSPDERWLAITAQSVTTINLYGLERRVMGAPLAAGRACLGDHGLSCLPLAQQQRLSGRHGGRGQRVRRLCRDTVPSRWRDP